MNMHIGSVGNIQKDKTVKKMFCQKRLTFFQKKEKHYRLFVRWIPGVQDSQRNVFEIQSRHGVVGASLRRKQTFSIKNVVRFGKYSSTCGISKFSDGNEAGCLAGVNCRDNSLNVESEQRLGRPFSSLLRRGHQLQDIWIYVVVIIVECTIPIK